MCLTILFLSGRCGTGCTRFSHSSSLPEKCGGDETSELLFSVSACASLENNLRTPVSVLSSSVKFSPAAVCVVGRCFRAVSYATSWGRGTRGVKPRGLDGMAACGVNADSEVLVSFGLFAVLSVGLRPVGLTSAAVSSSSSWTRSWSLSSFS